MSVDDAHYGLPVADCQVICVRWPTLAVGPMKDTGRSCDTSHSPNLLL
jgi:hypothetical protein